MKNINNKSIIKNLITLVLMFSILFIGFSFIKGYILSMGVNTDTHSDIRVYSDFLQMQLADSDDPHNRQFIGKLHFEIEMKEEDFNSRFNTKSRFVKNWFKGKSQVLIKKDLNKFVSGDFDFINSKGYEGDDYATYKERLRSEIYFNQNDYILKVPHEALDQNKRIKEDYNFEFIITVQMLRMTNDTFLMKNGVIIEKDFKFSFNVINNGIIKFNEVSKGMVSSSSQRNIAFREMMLSKGKIVRLPRSITRIFQDLFNSIFK